MHLTVGEGAPQADAKRLAAERQCAEWQRANADLRVTLEAKSNMMEFQARVLVGGGCGGQDSVHLSQPLSKENMFHHHASYHPQEKHFLGRVSEIFFTAFFSRKT